MLIRNIFTAIASFGLFLILLIRSTHAHIYPHSHIDHHHFNDKDARSLNTTSNRRTCGSKEPSEEDRRVSTRIVNEWKKKSRLARLSMIKIPTYYHVITNHSIGNSQTEVEDSITVLNNSFAPYFNFNLVATTYTDNPSWFNKRSDQLAMKSALRKGGCDALNIYSNSGYDALGFSHKPTECRLSSGPWVYDGVVIQYNTVPGGSFTNFNEGHTLTHEVGHWLGLFHSFQGGCSVGSDFINDTPAHKVNWNCLKADSCPSNPGQDPIHNFMNYTPDSCMNEFTNGQYERMVAEWEAYRKPAHLQSPRSNPSDDPSASPSNVPSSVPNIIPSSMPSGSPKIDSSPVLNGVPSMIPFATPSSTPSVDISTLPSNAPSSVPSAKSSFMPSGSSIESSSGPSVSPSMIRSIPPTSIVGSAPLNDDDAAKKSQNSSSAITLLTFVMAMIVGMTAFLS